MLKLIPFTALAVAMSSGVALADRHPGGDHWAAVEHRAPGPVVRDHRDFHGGGVVRGGGEWRGGGGVVVRGGREWHGGGGVVVRGGREWRGGDRVVVRNGGYYGARRPIFVRRPIIRERYYDYYRRPALIVENYSAMPGYYWVPGAWSWTGYEWTWQPGHYEPDPNYVGAAYDGAAYDGGYYDSGY
jgi:hypothetical protein